MDELIFAVSSPGRSARAQHPTPGEPPAEIPTALLRDGPPALPELSEL